MCMCSELHNTKANWEYTLENLMGASFSISVTATNITMKGLRRDGCWKRAAQWCFVYCCFTARRLRVLLSMIIMGNICPRH